MVCVICESRVNWLPDASGHVRCPSCRSTFTAKKGALSSQEDRLRQLALETRGSVGSSRTSNGDPFLNAEGR
jgi:hypothetical protein